MPAYPSFHALLLVVLLALLPAANTFAVVAYLPEWRYGSVNWREMSARVTHILVFSAEIGRDGLPSALDRLPSVEQLKVARKAPNGGAKILLCFGGNSRSDGFPNMVVTAARRRAFLEALLSLCDEYGFDGVDYNWEYPRNDQEWTYFGRLLEDTKKAFAASGRVITLAYYPDGAQERILARIDAASHVDLMHMMSYDQRATQHSSESFAQHTAIQGARLLPAKKLTLGLPFYGRDAQTGDWRAYRDMASEQWSKPDEDIAEGTQHYNGASMLKRKTRFAMDQGLGGVMIWEIGQDIDAADPRSLLAAVNEAVGTPLPPTSPKDEL